ncbi:MAG: hypothetical protein V4610_19695 [Pseudomonadota bacterium]|jgi:hypothetical protein
MKRMLRTMIGLVALSVATAPQSAAAFVWCSGPITSVQLDTNGFLTMNWGYGEIMLCNVNNDVTLVAPQLSFGYKTCQSLYSMALTARAGGRDFQASLPGETTCAGFGPNAAFVGNKYLGHFKTQ